jgi:hypothetical protein
MNGKGSRPRNCFSAQYRDNYETIFGTKKNTTEAREQEARKTEQTVHSAAQGVPSSTPKV